MLSIILGPAGAGKTRRVMEEMSRRAELGETNLMLIVPEQYSHNAERQLCAVCGDKMNLHGEVLSFSRLCSRVFAQTGGPAGQLLDGGGRILVMYRAMREVSQSLRLYGAGQTRVEILAGMLKMTEELKTSGVTPEKLAAASAVTKGTLSDKLYDLSLIADAYNSFFDDKTADPRDRLTYLAQVIEKSSLVRDGRIYIDGFTDFTVQELQVIEKIIAVTDVTVCLTCPSADCEEEAFALPVKTVSQLLRICKERNVEWKITEIPRQESTSVPELAYMEKMLFSDTDMSYPEECKSISLWKTASAAGECEFAASCVLNLLQEGYRRRDIAVVACDWDETGALMENVFEKYGVPVYLSRKTDILQKAPLLLAVSVLEIITSGWEYDTVFKYLKTGLCGISPEECDELENYVIKWNIYGSLWTRSEGWNMPVYDDERDNENVLERINKLRGRAVEPVKRLENKLRKAENAGQQIEALYDYFEDIGLPDRLEKKAEEFLSLGWLQLRDEYIQLWDILTGAMEQYYAIMNNVPADIGEFARLWPLMLSQYDMASIPVSLDRVGIGDISRHRRPGIKCLIVTGASEELLPKVSTVGGVLSEVERSALIPLGIDISGTAQERAGRELYSVYCALTMPSDRLYISYHTGDDKRPSSVILRLCKIFNLRCKTIDDEKCRIASLIPCFELAASNGVLGCAAEAYFDELPEYREKIASAKRAASAGRGKLSAASAKKLYGDKIYMSASRVDKFYSCGFSHFMQYGLGAKPRDQAELDAPAAGVFMHYLLENVTKEMKTAGGFKSVTEKQCGALVKKYTSEYVETRLQGMKDKSPRFVYLFDRLVKDGENVLWELVTELRDSDFVPVDFELNFSPGKDFPPVAITDGEIQMGINGIADRVDGWVHNGKIYLRVVDYKTGRKSFSLSDVWYGLGLQMLIYLFALEKNGSDRYGMEVVPAGVLYVPARDDVLKVSRDISDEELQTLRSKKVKRTGLILDDEEVVQAMSHGESGKYLPLRFTKNGMVTGESLTSLERLGYLAKHVDRLVKRIGREISDGYIDASPFYRNPQDNACVFCRYKNACRFSESGGDKVRYLKKLTSEEVWANIKKEAENERF